MKKIKVLFVLGHSYMTGSTISFKNIIDGVVDDCLIAVAVSKKNVNPEVVSYLKSLGVTIEYFTYEPMIYPLIREDKKVFDTILYPYKILKKIINIYRSKKEITSIVERVRPDIIHTNIGVLYQVISVAEKFSLPHIHHIREYQTKDFGWKIFPSKSYYQNKLRRSHVIAITEDIFNYFELRNHNGACVMYDGILSSSSVTFNPNKDKFFLCASRISEAKGIDSAINAFDKVADQLPDHELWIAGGYAAPEYEEVIGGLIQSKNYSHRIKLLGHRDDVIDLMKKATALIVASRFEGLGRMTVEATFSGCLVIGRDSGGTKEVLELTKGGYLFQSDDQLADLMVQVAKLDAKSYMSLIADSQKVAVNNFSNEYYCKCLLEKYRELVTSQLH